MQCLRKICRRNDVRSRLNAFTLLEVLIASCIIGIFLGVLLAGFSTNMQSAQTANDYIAAIQMAQFRFNTLISGKKLKACEDSGSSGQFKWRNSVKKSDNGKDWRIRVEVTFAQGDVKRSYVMDSLLIHEPKKRFPASSKKNNKSTKKLE